MSDDRVLAALTEVLRHRLHAVAQAAISGAEATSGRPDRLQGISNTDVGLNVFLAQTRVDPQHRAVATPTRRSTGSYLENPTLALEATFLLSFYGTAQRQDAERLMGAAAQDLEARPTITPTMIEAARDAMLTTDPTHPLMSADMEDHPPIRLHPLDLDLETMSRIWSMFGATPYHLSITYVARPVLLEAKAPVAPALPVLYPGGAAILLQEPRIERIQSAQGPQRPIVTGHGLAIEGRHLIGADTTVRLDDEAVTPSELSEHRIVIPMDAGHVPPDRLVAGAHTLRVEHHVELGQPPTPHAAARSALAVFVLRPQVPFDTMTGTYGVAVTGVLPMPDPTRRQGTMTVTLDPPVREGQRASLVLNEHTPSDPETHVFDLTPATTDSSVLAFPFHGVRPGLHFVRVRVDGAETPLQLDPDRPDHGPEVTIAP